MPAKPRSDAKLLNLPADQQDRICAWLLEGVETDEGMSTGYAVVARQIFQDLGIKTSAGALSEFYRQVVAPRRLRRAAAAADQLADEARATGEQFDAGAMAAVKQMAFELMAGGQASHKDVIAFFGAVLEMQKIELKRADLAIKERRVVLLEGNAAAAKAKLENVAAKGGLSEETLRQIEEAAGLL